MKRTRPAAAQGWVARLSICYTGREHQRERERGKGERVYAKHDKIDKQADRQADGQIDRQKK